MSSNARIRFGGAILAGFLTIASMASASTVELGITSYSPKDVSAAQVGLDAFAAGLNTSAAYVQSSANEGFESFSAWNGVTGTSNPVTAVGSFTSLGGKGSGSSAINGGAALEVRSDAPMNWSRYNTSSPAGSNWLDTNDTLGIKWEVGGLPEFNAIAFLLTDVADVGAKFSITVGDTLFANLLGATKREQDGGLHLVTILLPNAVSDLSILLANDRLNDGFGIDNIFLANVAPIPVPPAAALLVTGVIALAGLQRRRKARAEA